MLSAEAECDLPAVALRAIVAKHDATNLNGRTVRALLSDECGEKARAYRREIVALGAAADAEVAAEIRQWNGSVPVGLLTDRIVRRLGNDAGIADDLAVWAIRTWMEALGIEPPATRTQVAVRNHAPTLSRASAPYPTAPSTTAGASGHATTSDLAVYAGKVRSVPITKRKRRTSTALAITSIGAAVCFACMWGRDHHWLRARTDRTHVAVRTTANTFDATGYGTAGLRSTRLADAARRVNNGIVTHLIEIERSYRTGKLTEVQAEREYAALHANGLQALRLSQAAVTRDSGDEDAWQQEARALYYLGEYGQASRLTAEAMRRFRTNTDLGPLKARIDAKLAAGHSTIRTDP